MINEPLLGQLNQGSIFCCAKADRYHGCAVSGVVLTARCDLEQDKYNVLNYAPVVSLVDWLNVDGFDLLLSRARADLKSRTESALKTIGLPPSILNSQTVTTILESFIRAPDAEKAVKKADGRFAELSARYRDLARWIDQDSRANSDIFVKCDPLVHAILKDLIYHRLAGYYFLPRLSAGGKDEGFVVLLREVNHLPRRLAVRIAAGCDAADAELASRPDWLAYVDFTLSDFAMPLGEIASPEVEHLLQTFSHLFGRIGLPDPDKKQVETFCGISPPNSVNGPN